MTCYGTGGINPHTEKSEPGKKLHHSKLNHCPWHMHQVVNNLFYAVKESFALFFFFFKRFNILRRIFLCTKHSPAYSAEKSNRSGIKGIDDRRRNLSGGRTVAYAEPIGKNVWKRRSDNGAES